jgi:ubiquinone/menaquinone biosynthesis C-methylase UbiE
MPTDMPKEQNAYVMDSESATEMARLINQDRVMTETMGGLFSERNGNLTGIQTILDIGCGPGGWVLDVARAYPDRRVVGVDISNMMIEYARTLAFSQRLDNAEFQVANVHVPMSFDDNTFDFINARFMVGFTPTKAWPTFLEECLRILKPGGIFRLTETDIGSSTSASFTKLTATMPMLLKRLGFSFSPDGSSLGITIAMRRLLREAGFTNIQKTVHALETAPGLPGYQLWVDNMKVTFLTAKPAIMKLQIMPEEEYDSLYDQAMMDMLADDFYAIDYILTMWGSKP